MSNYKATDDVVICNYTKLARLRAIVNGEFPSKRKAIEQFLEDNFDINYSVPDNQFFTTLQPQFIGCTALKFALEVNDFEVFNLLLKCNVDLSTENTEGGTMLHDSMLKICLGKSEFWDLKGKLNNPFTHLILSELIKRNDCINTFDKHGISHFHIACMVNNVDAVEFFVKHGVPVNQAIKATSNRLPGHTALHLAARYCSVETGELLLRCGADPQQKNAVGLTPMYILIRRTLELLNLMNIQKQELTENYWTEIDDNRKMIRILLEKRSPSVVNFVDEIGLTGLHVFCILNDDSAIDRAITQTADLNKCIRENSPIWAGYTPLHFAAHVNISIVKKLLECKARIDIKNKNGVTPFDLCIERYAVSDIHVIVTSETLLQSVQFSVDIFSLTDFIFSMKSENLFDSLLRRVDKNMAISLDSPLWPGCSLLHLAILFCDRIESLQSSIYSYNIRKAPQYLLSAFKDNYREEVHKLYCKRINKILSLCESCINKSDAKGSTPLHLAFRLQNRSVLRLLLKYSEQIEDVVDERGVSHFHIACVMKNTTLAKRLLTFGADVNLPMNCTFDYLVSDDHYLKPQVFLGTPGSTPLHLAVVTNNVVLVEMLLEHGADIFLRDGDGLTPLHRVVALTERCDVGETLLSATNLKECVTHFGLSFLHVACYVGHEQAVKYLLDSGANIEATYELPEYTGNCNQDEKFLLLEHGVDVHARDCLGNTPLHVAAELCPRYNNAGSSFVDEDIFEILIEYGAEIDDENVWGETALGVFMRSTVMTLRGIEIFVRDHNCRMNIFNPKNNKGFLAYVLPRYYGEVGITDRYFYRSIINEPSKHDCDKTGRSVIHNIVSSDEVNISSAQYISIIDGFIKAGFDVNHQDEQGRTALHVAVEFENYGGIVGLLENGADINILDVRNAPAFTFSEDILETEEENRLNIFAAFLSTILKMNIAGLKISTANQRMATQASERIEINEDYIQSCVEELNLLQMQKISESSSTWFDLLSYSNKLLKAVLFRPHEITNVFEKEMQSVRKTFPLYAGLLTMQYRKALVRTQRVKPAKDSLSVIAGLAGGIHLPELCSDFIVEFLNNHDLRNLILSNSVPCKTAK